MNIDKNEIYLIHGHELSRIKEVMVRLYDYRMMTFDDRRDLAKILDSTMEDVAPALNQGRMKLGSFIISDAAGNEFRAHYKRDGMVDILLQRKGFKDYIILASVHSTDPITGNDFDSLKFVEDNYELSSEEI